MEILRAALGDCDVISVTIIGIVIIAVALVLRSMFHPSNGKSNIFAYEMREKSKHGGSLARAMSIPGGKNWGARRFPA